LLPHLLRETKEVPMSRNDTQPSACHAHFNPAGEGVARRPDGTDGEATARGHHAADHRDGCTSNWEAAWIDLGGEG
jgi:hypothetical protein